MAQNWFYADKHNQQQGPVDESTLVAAYQRGDVLITTLVWREGLPNWIPFSSVAAGLGIALPSAPPLLPRTGKVQIVKSGKSGSSTAVIIIVVVFGLIFMVGILAAIALPAYQDYTIRARVANAYMQGIALKNDVAEFYTREKRCPGNGEGTFKKADEYVSPYVSSIQFGALKSSGSCAIQVSLESLGSTQTQGAVLQLAMAADGTWSESSSSLAPRYLPMSMRK